MKKILNLTMLCMALLYSCKEEVVVTDQTKMNLSNARGEVAGIMAEPDRYLLLAEQSQNRISVVNATNGTFFWNWKAGVNNNVSAAHVSWFTNPSDAKRVYNGLYILATASGGGVALIRQSDKKAVFYANPGGNPHSAELLPDGNTVTASSTGGYLMIHKMDTLHHPSTAFTRKITQEDAHNVVWDKTRQRLWSASKNKLYAYSYNFSCTSPNLTLVKTVTLPAGNAHDLFPVYGQDSLWISTSNKVWVVNLNTDAVTEVSTLARIKSVSSGGTGYPTVVLQGLNATDWWNTKVINMNTGATVFEGTGLKIYKARWKIMNAFSYPANDVFHFCN